MPTRGHSAWATLGVGDRPPESRTAAHPDTEGIRRSGVAGRSTAAGAIPGGD
jgi:hypothetical protein